MTGIFSKNGVSLERLQTLGKGGACGEHRACGEGRSGGAKPDQPADQSELEKVLGVELLDRRKKPFQPTFAAQRLADSCERFVREVEEVSAEAAGLARPITVGAGEVVIREFLIPKIGRQSKGKQPVSWVMRNLTGKRIQEELAAERLDVGLASGLEETDPVKVVNLESYGMKLLLPKGARRLQHGLRRDAAATGRIYRLGGTLLDFGPDGDTDDRMIVAGVAK